MRIRLDTDELKEKSAKFESSANIIRQLGVDIMNVANSLPSYDGQLSGPARAIGAAIQIRHQNLAQDLLGDSRNLAQTAAAFEQADGEAISFLDSIRDGISKWWTSLDELPLYTPRDVEILPDSYPSPFDMPSVGDTKCGYACGPKNTMIIWWRGKYYVYPFDPKDSHTPPEPYRTTILKFKKCMDDYSNAEFKLEGDLALDTGGFIPGVGDFFAIGGILWKSGWENKLDASGIRYEFEKKILNKLDAKKAEHFTPIVDLVAEEQDVQGDLQEMSEAAAEFPDPAEMNVLSDPTSGFVSRWGYASQHYEVPDPTPPAPTPPAGATPSAPAPFTSPAPSDPAASSGQTGSPTPTPSLIPTPSPTPP